MSAPFWEAKSLDELDATEWEALCDGCGKCCLHKLEDADTLELHFTNVACRLLDLENCRCGDYKARTRHVPDCMVLNAAQLEKIDWLPETCAYYLRAAVHRAGQSVRGWCVTEEESGDLWGHLVPLGRIHDGA
jgi:uncharacterized cysteine cluster protein YcgN (CxxCxxCC family)